MTDFVGCLVLIPRLTRLHLCITDCHEEIAAVHNVKMNSAVHLFYGTQTMQMTGILLLFFHHKNTIGTTQVALPYVRTTVMWRINPIRARKGIQYE